MKKLSNITESVWGDIRKRGLGDEVKAEDDVNLMSVDEFYEYLKNYCDDGARTYIDSRKDFISIDAIQVNNNYKRMEQLFLVLSCDSDRLITLPYSFMENFKNVFMKLNDKFLLDFPEAKDKEDYENLLNTSFIEIHPKDGGKITNRFFIEVFDFIYKELNPKITESIWGDIRKRGFGDEIKKEDDINNLDRDGLYEYIFDLYEQIDPFPKPLKSQTSQTYTYFSIPIFKSNYKVYRLDCTFDNSKISKITLMANDADVKDFKQALIDNFDCTIRHDGALKITAKDGTVSNQVCMDLIKTIVENAPEPYLKKRGQ